MANTYTPQDVYQLFNEMVSLATGRTDLKAVDTTSFVSVGQTLLNIANENTLNAISTVISRTIFSIRPYSGKIYSLRREPERWGGYIRKLTPLRQEFEASSDWNTNLSPNQLADGQSIDMYEINAPKMLQTNFIGTKVLQKHITRFRDQLAQAFQNENEFMRFVDAVMTQFANEVEQGNEVQSRLTLINYATGMVDMALPTVIDLTAEFNAEFGTSYTRAEILTGHLTQFMQFFVSTVKILSDRLTDIGVLYHANIDGYRPIDRHTPKSFQRLIMYSPMFTKAEAMVFSEIFNPIYLELGQNFERVNYWQSQKKPEAMMATPNILDTTTGASRDGSAVTLPYVVGMLFDEQALGVMPQFEYASTTPFNSRGGYYNMYYHWRFNSYADYTENAVLFIMGDGGANASTSSLLSTQETIKVQSSAKTKK